MVVSRRHGATVLNHASQGARNVSIGEDRVIKTQEPHGSRRERLRTLAGRAVGQQTGHFIVPEITSFDDARGEIVFERLPLIELRRALSELGRSIELAGRSAAALAAIHRYLQPCDRPIRPPSGALGIDRARALVPLHGDFGMRNLFYHPPTNGIAIIDWSNADWVGLDADLAAPEIDVAVFLMSFFHRRAFGRWPIARRHEIARHFLATYASESPHGLDLPALIAVVAATTPAFTRLTTLRKGRLGALASRHGLFHLDFFLRRLYSSGARRP